MERGHRIPLEYKRLVLISLPPEHSSDEHIHPGASYRPSPAATKNPSSLDRKFAKRIYGRRRVEKKDSSLFPKLILPSTVDRTRVWRDPRGPLLPIPPPSDVRKIVRARKGEKCTQRGEYKRIACKGVRDDCRHCCSGPTAAVQQYTARWPPRQSGCYDWYAKVVRPERYCQFSLGRGEMCSRRLFSAWVNTHSEEHGAGVNGDRDKLPTQQLHNFTNLSRITTPACLRHLHTCVPTCSDCRVS
ncbi:hypothetical protein E2C01_066391 [Portunus trituberculatus]|uniref:Uncharacterized protein n=1 Tax=Portunus trituberculatus TaxID=210409 RepID=A0A5B7HTQ6_PORTR|nr:hypothetical protein [Portunus trituberculatus]